MGHRIQMFSSQKKHPLLYSGCLPGENADSASELAAGEAHAHDHFAMAQFFHLGYFGSVFLCYAYMYAACLSGGKRGQLELAI